jgi:selenoprotein W-related protein
MRDSAAHWGIQRGSRRRAIAEAHRIEISYCRLCGWLLRASWMAQELLTTFAEELAAVTLIPDGTGGVFEIRLDGEPIWSRKEVGRFPEITELKRLVRDRVAPDRPLGHVDKG